MRPLFSKPGWLVFVAALGAGCSGTDSGTTLPTESSGGAVSGGGASIGGAPAGGSTAIAGGYALGGAAVGGVQTVGGASSTVGTRATGGTSNALGGAPNTGGRATGGALATGGNATGGAFATGGALATGGAFATGGTPAATGGALATGGTRATGGPSTTGGSNAAGGTQATGGVPATGGSKATGGAPATGGAGGTFATCGSTPAPNPFGCTFGWGINGNPTSYLQFASTWAGYNIQANGTFPSNGFDSGSWLNRFANLTAVPAYYAYIIGYYGHANGFQDGNVNPNGPNLSNSMGPLLLGVNNAACPQGTICDQNLMVTAYAWYAAQTYAVFKKPIIWLLEGDFIQYSIEGSSTGLSYAQLGQLAAQIARAIKCNDPPAVVAINYSTWISSSQLTSYISGINTAMAALGTSYDMIWTTGAGNSANAGNSSYANLHAVTGKPILVDESFGLSAAGDTWANQSAATINARIAGGVVAANITTATPSYLQTNVTTTLAPSALETTCF